MAKRLPGHERAAPCHGHTVKQPSSRLGLSETGSRQGALDGTGERSLYWLPPLGAEAGRGRSHRDLLSEGAQRQASRPAASIVALALVSSLDFARADVARDGGSHACAEEVRLGPRRGSGGIGDPGAGRGRASATVIRVATVMWFRVCVCACV